MDPRNRTTAILALGAKFKEYADEFEHLEGREVWKDFFEDKHTFEQDVLVDFARYVVGEKELKEEERKLFYRGWNAVEFVDGSGVVIDVGVEKPDGGLRTVGRMLIGMDSLRRMLIEAQGERRVV
jgi:hypothetical protein